MDHLKPDGHTSNGQEVALQREGDLPGAPSPLGSQGERIARYYGDAWWEYRYFWSGKDSLALHYGYWDERVSSHAESLLRLNAVLAERVALTRSDLVLDAGCGWGGSSFWINRSIGARTFGINIDGQQVAMCWAKARSLGLTRLANFARQDYHRTLFAPAVFDVVWALESVCHSPDKQCFFTEAFRLLRPGGRLVMGDLVRAGRPLSAEQETALHEMIDPWVVPDLATVPELGTYATNAGFANFMASDETEHIYPSAVRLARAGERTSMPAHAFNRLRLPFYTETMHENWKSSLAQLRAMNLGAWKYAILTAVKPL